MPEERNSRVAAFALILACAALALAAAGCGAANYRRITDAEDFEKQVAQSPRPVLVELYKLGCPTCGLIEPMLDELADEYGTRVTFASFKLMEPYFAVTSWEVVKKYDVALLFPTVVLFVDGKPKERWILNYDKAGYRRALDAVAGPPPVKKS